MNGDPAETTTAPVAQQGCIQWPAKASVAGVNVSLVDYDQAVAHLMAAARVGASAVVACHAVHAIVVAGRDPELRQQVNQFSMITPDGQPVRWALNALHRAALSDRVYGPELMLRVCAAAAQTGVPIYLYGGTPDVLAKLQTNLSAQFPNLQLAGSEAPPFRELSDDENEAVCRRINESGAGIVMIGLGCPKQDRFAARNRERIRSVQLCIGAAFDFHAGVKPMAPRWMQKHGLEWVFRLSCEPRRLWRRYLVTNTQFTLAILMQFAKLRMQRRAPAR
ncbi:UDP-N-acetyl-D-mannosaminuronic acid transferase [Stieleria neptunia]|uniref:UDP-N-acetyl-D-mannosaminuronic acid transferase n=1 Tax=Stieleria neptunia TaxID=2527979 RepID=A0A518HT87_9BACT|nr:WecB/TagA/CpsF family glycosyltransferase [Stieleria neptunia]QDV44021.1 UDP-N-acetyl-D-mannosaminuronic acid transferase [Stieleria neptunia]